MTNFIPGDQSSVSVFTAQNLTPRQIEVMTVMTNPAYLMGKAMIPLVMSRYGEGSNIKSGSRTYGIPRKGNQFIAAQAQATVLSSDSLTATITLSDPTFQSFAVGKLITDPETNTLAKIISVSPGQIVATFDSNSNAATTFSASDFAYGDTVSERGAVGNQIQRKSVQGVLTFPAIDEYPIGSWDQNAVVFLEEMAQKTYINNTLNLPYYAYNKEMEVINRTYSEQFAYAYGDYTAVTSNTTPRTPSLINQLKNFGAGNVRGKSARMTLAEFQETAKEYIRLGGVQSETVFIFGGLDYLENIYNILKPYVFTAGTSNVVGGPQVKGLDVSWYEMFGKKFAFILDMFPENPNMWGRTRSNSAFWVDAAEVTLENGQKAAPIYKVWYSTDGLRTWFVNGGIDHNGNAVQVGSNDQLSCTTNMRMEGSYIIANPQGSLYHAVS